VLVLHIVSIGGSVYLFRGSSNEKALSTDQPNMQNFELALRSDDSASAGKKKASGLEPGATIGDAASFPVSMSGAAFRSS
jgi:hypothetical protein